VYVVCQTKFEGLNRHKNTEVYQCFSRRAIFEIPGSDIEADACVPYIWTTTGELNSCFEVSVQYMAYSLKFEPG
jgi:N6-adenosine-specific RNA methylase IME4